MVSGVPSVRPEARRDCSCHRSIFWTVKHPQSISSKGPDTSAEHDRNHASVTNHFNPERHLYSRPTFKPNRAVADAEWRQPGVAKGKGIRPLQRRVRRPLTAQAQGASTPRPMQWPARSSETAQGSASYLLRHSRQAWHSSPEGWCGRAVPSVSTHRKRDPRAYLEPRHRR